MSARRVTFSALRSSRDSLVRISLRRLRASAVVIGAGATGPRLRLASLRLGVGLPLGAVGPDAFASPLLPVSTVSSDTSGSGVGELSFLRPSRFTLVRLLPLAGVHGGASVDKLGNSAGTRYR